MNNENALGDLVEDLFELHSQKAIADETVKSLAERISILETSILSELERTGLERVSCVSGSVSRTAELYPKILDWEALIHFMDSEGYPSMVQKRVSSKAFKEYFLERGEYPPGTDGTTGFRLNRRAAR